MKKILFAAVMAVGLLASMVAPANAEPQSARLVVITTGGTIATSTDPSGVRRPTWPAPSLPRASMSKSST